MEDSKTFQSWFLVDISPFKMALLNGIKKWSYAFKKHLLDHVIDSLDDLDNFIKGADEGLSRQVVLHVLGGGQEGSGFDSVWALSAWWAGS